MTTPLGQVTGELQDLREMTTFVGTVAPTISNTKAYTGTYSIRIAGNTAQMAGLSFAAQSSVRCGVWLNHAGAGTTAPAPLLTLYNGGTLAAQFRWNGPTGNLELGDGTTTWATVAASGAGITPQDTWMHVALAYIGGGSIVGYVNGIAVISYTSSGLPATVTVAYFGGIRWNNYAYFDDFYVDGGIVSTAETPPPDRFLFSLANAAGASSQWTPTGAASNYQCVDEAVPNDDTDYVLATAADLVDKYETANITVPSNYGIVAAIPIALAKVMAAGPTLKLVAADGVNSDLESAAKTPGTSYGYLWESLPLAPDGADWNETKFNAAQFGLKSAGTF